MKLHEIRLNMLVYDTYWPVNRRGEVIEILKTRVKVKWLGNGIWVYDLAHLQFLAPL